jgi:hypothetical protein
MDPADIDYCYFCFSWITEEKWNEHCQSHIDSLSSKRCGSITYCSTLLRPALCPFCIGNKKLDASIRLETWTRENQLRKHIGTHLKGSRWPLKCPFPLCDLELNKKENFLYHLDDVHSLKMSPDKTKTQAQEIAEEPFIAFHPNPTTGKRKRDDQDSQSHDANKKQLSDHLPMRDTSVESQIISPHMLDKTITPEDSFSDLPMPSFFHSGLVSPPITEKTCSSETENSTYPHLDDDDALFSMYLRSHSPSIFEGDEGKETLIFSKAQSIGALHTTTEANTCSVSSSERIAAVSTGSLPQTKKPRIILRVRPEPEIDSTISQKRKLSKQKSQSKSPARPRKNQLKSKSQAKIKIKLRPRDKI